MMSRALLCASLFVTLAGCEGAPTKQSRVFPAGEKATAGPLTYAILDAQVARQLGSAADARSPENRFYLLRISASNTSKDIQAIPPLALIDDSGKIYSELVDGSGVPDWLGVLRKIPGNGTLLGNVLFDAPVQHYKLRLTDPDDNDEISFDLPESLVYEEMQDVDIGSPGLPSQKTSSAGR